jgi:hypothetical protein
LDSVFLSVKNFLVWRVNFERLTIKASTYEERMEIDDISLDEKPEIAQVAAATPTPIPSVEKITDEAIDAIGSGEKMRDAKVKIDPEEITEPPESAEKVERAARKTFPDPAREGLMLALSKEESTASALRKKSEEADKLIARIDLMLDLTAELSKNSDQDTIDFSEKAVALLKDLKAQGVDVWKSEETKEIAKERVSELKSLINSQIDKSRTQEQMILTKMQSYAHDLMAILESAKGLVRDDSRGKATFVRNQRTNG